MGRGTRTLLPLSVLLAVAAAAPAAHAQDNRPEFVIAAMGDSFGSGEGNPETPGDHEPDGDVRPGGRREEWGPTALARRCHRSPKAYSGVAQKELQRRYPGVKVTLLHVACSGATVLEGLLGPDDGIEPQGPFDVPAQINQLNTLLSEPGKPRHIDALLVSIGVNDLSFGDVVLDCLVPLFTPSNAPCDENSRTRFKVSSGLANLPKKLIRLQDAIAGRATGTVGNQPAPNLVTLPQRTYLVEYPDPLHDENGQLCDGTQTDDPFYKEVDLGESTWLRDEVLVPLNAVLEEQAFRGNGDAGQWTYVSGASTAPLGVKPSFLEYGFCAADGHRYMAENHEAVEGQGDDLNDVANVSNGMAHPNAAGHEDIARHVVRALDAQVQARLGTATPSLALRRVTGERVRRLSNGRRIVTPGQIGVTFSAPPSGSEARYRITIKRVHKVRGRKQTVTKDLPAGATTYTHTETGLFTISVRQCSPIQCSGPSNTLRVSNVAPSKLGLPTDLRRAGGQSRPPAPGEVNLLRNKTIQMAWTPPRLRAAPKGSVVNTAAVEWSYFRVDYTKRERGTTPARSSLITTAASDVTIGSFLNPLNVNDVYDIVVRACSNLGCTARGAGPRTEAVRTPVAASKRLPER